MKCDSEIVFHVAKEFRFFLWFFFVVFLFFNLSFLLLAKDVFFTFALKKEMWENIGHRQPLKFPPWKNMKGPEANHEGDGNEDIGKQKI